MKSSIFYLLLIFSLSLATSCASDDDLTFGFGNGNNNDETPVTICGRDMTEITGTTCCVAGDRVVSLGETVTYTYSVNVGSDEYEWMVEYGSISILSVDGNTATVKIGPDFTNGSIACGNDMCLDFLEISREGLPEDVQV
jgi:hypothetical protein